MRTIRTLLCLAALAGFVAAAAGCNTTEGFGKDMQEGGAALSRSAQDHND